MKRLRPIDILLPLAIFLALEAASVVMATHGDTVQRTRLLRFTRSMNAGLWQMSQNTRVFFARGAENERLCAENAELKQTISSLEATLAAIGDSRPADSLPSKTEGYSYIPASVVKNSISSSHNSLILRRGSEDGVKEEMGVVTSCGAIGIVQAVDRHYCRAVSFLDTDQKVSVKVARNGSFGLMQWDGSSSRGAIIRELPAHTDIAEGDTLATSGYSSIFPPDIPLAKVVKINSDGVYLEVRTELFEDFGKLQDVFIVVNPDSEEIRRIEK